MALTLKLISHLIVIVGGVAVTIGAGLVAVAAGWIVGGVLAAAYGLLMIDVESPWRLEVKRR